MVDFAKMLEDIHVEKCERAKAFAELPENIIRLDRMYEIADGKACPVGDIPDFVFKIGDYRIVYSVEEHPQKDGSIKLLRHCSISTKEFELAYLRESDADLAVNKLKETMCGFLQHLGFDTSGATDGRSFVEKIGSTLALNFVQVM